MSDILDRARAHFSNMGRRRVEVPEWGEDGAPAIFFAPSLTLRDRQSVERRCKGDVATRMILTVIMFAQKEDGTRAFTDDASTRRAFETEVDPAVVARLAAAILQVSESDDLEK